ncbi:sugar kinase [Enterovibrio sp. ZSDZ35]|uniref:Sugar kinase n=1 Tax=Enterovibrio qingdaonensis TaxID=2899818 RepID=A0ABT5QIU9_9GAMM|nr:sugar kinase [Enterovibrio sp. ZSDZ35]MDD1780603.1 sugar kinase [Enterovibrio sp. ZSDZ35]
MPQIKKTKKIAIIGECMIELSGMPFSTMQQTFGGDTLNTAVYLSRVSAARYQEQSIDVSYVTALGEDVLSDEMLNRWQGEGINTRLVLRDSKRNPGLYMIQLDESGERNFLYWRNQSAARYLFQHPEFQRLAQALRQVDVVMISGISLAILPAKDRKSMLALIASLNQAGVEIVFDSNYRPTLWPSDDHGLTAKQAYRSMYEFTDLALVTFKDEQTLWGDASPLATIARLSTFGIQKIVVKHGAHGCLFQDWASDVPQYIATKPVKSVVDTTSAGDSFNGGFLAAYLAGRTIIEACHQGNALAGTVIQHRGAIISRDLTFSAAI